METEKVRNGLNETHINTKNILLYEKESWLMNEKLLRTLQTMSEMKFIYLNM